MALDGGCHCGEVRYRLTSEPLLVHCCHCRFCQVQTGSAFVLNALYEPDRIELVSGNPQANRVHSGSGHQKVFRCSSCQTAMWSEYREPPCPRFVRLATLDDPTALTPDVHIFTRSKLPWLSLPEGIPTFEAFYDWKEVWPEESQRRYRILVGKA